MYDPSIVKISLRPRGPAHCVNLVMSPKSGLTDSEGDLTNSTNLTSVEQLSLCQPVSSCLLLPLCLRGARQSPARSSFYSGHHFYHHLLHLFRRLPQQHDAGFGILAAFHRSRHHAASSAPLDFVGNCAGGIRALCFRCLNSESNDLLSCAAMAASTASIG